MIKVKGKNPKEKMLFMLDYVKNHFNSNNRAVDEFGNCLYQDKKGNKCAIGLFLPNKIAKMQLTCSVSQLFNKHQFLWELDNFKDISIDFLVRLQCLHDSTISWDKNGLTKCGMERYNEIKKYIDSITSKEN